MPAVKEPAGHVAVCHLVEDTPVDVRVHNHDIVVWWERLAPTVRLAADGAGGAAVDWVKVIVLEVFILVDDEGTLVDAVGLCVTRTGREQESTGW